MMHGQVIDNLVMGLFNLNFAMSDYKETLEGCDCSRVNLEEIQEWSMVHHGITHESMSVMK